MAGTNQSLKPKMGTFGDLVVDAQFSFLQNGASTPTTTYGKGIYSITRTGTGAYTIVLQGKFIRCLCATATIATATGTTVMYVKFVSESATAVLGTDTTTGFSTVKLVTRDNAGNAAEEALATGTVVSINLQLSLSPLNP